MPNSRMAWLALMVTMPHGLQSQSPVMPTRHVVGGVVELRHDERSLNRAPKWSLDPKPVMIAGGAADPDHDLTTAFYVQLLPDGGIATLSPIGSHLYWFPGSGDRGRELSRQGSGPGELMAPGGMAQVGDTVVIQDNANGRVNWIVPAKGFVASAPWPNPSLRPTGFVGALRDGRLVFTSSGRTPSASRDSISRGMAQVFVTGARAASVSIVATVPDIDFVRLETRYGGRRSLETRPLRFTRYAHVAAWDTVIATSGASGFRIDLRGPDGAPIAAIVVARRRRAVTKVMRDIVVGADLQQLDGPASERMVDARESRRIAEAMPSADSLPGHGKFFVTPGRVLWVEDYVAPDDTIGGATAFRQDGAIIGRLTWSGARSPVAFGDDRVVMKEADEDGVVGLKVYRIRR